MIPDVDYHLNIQQGSFLDNRVITLENNDYLAKKALLPFPKEFVYNIQGYTYKSRFDFL